MMLNREEEKEKLFQEATRFFKFTSDDLCSYSMHNGQHFEFHQELIDELVQEKKLVKKHYDIKEDTFYKFGEYANPEFIVVYQKNLFYGEEPMSDEEFINSLLED